MISSPRFPAIVPGWAGIIVLGGCVATTDGPGYAATMSEAGPLAAERSRIVILRRNDRYDDYSASPAQIKADAMIVGDLAYGGFLVADREAGAVLLTASGNDPDQGTCELVLQTLPAETVYIVVAPRSAHISAGLLGSLLADALLPPGFGTAVYASVGELVASAAVSATVSAAAGVGAQKLESGGNVCGGPFKLARIDEEAARAYLADLKPSN